MTKGKKSHKLIQLPIIKAPPKIEVPLTRATRTSRNKHRSNKIILVEGTTKQNREGLFQRIVRTPTIMPGKNLISQTHIISEMRSKDLPTHHDMLPKTTTMSSPRFVSNPTPSHYSIFGNQNSSPKMRLLHPETPKPFLQ